MKTTPFFILFSLFVLSWSGCSEEVQKRMEARPTAFGPLNKIAVIAEEDLWESPLADTFDYYFASAYPILPQPEPIFDLTHFTPAELMEQKERRELRIYVILADLSEPNSGTVKLVKQDVGSEKIREALEGSGYKATVGVDKWADGQIVIYLFGKDREALVENIKQNFAGVVNRLRKFEAPKVAAGVYLGGRNEPLEEELRSTLGVQLKLPKNYYKAMLDEETRTMWLRSELDKASFNILVHKEPYKDQKQLTREGLLKIRNDLGRQYVASEIPDTYMTTNVVDLPYFVEPMTLNNYYMIEGRGIWEMENDYMGGPAVSFLLHNPNTNELLFLDGFIYAPGQKKRFLMQQLEHVMRTVKF
jgi:hypothetical protein